MDTEMVRSIYAHASWANEKLFDAAAQIGEPQLIHAAGDAVSILELLVHLVDVQRTWLARAQHAAVSPLDPNARVSLTALREAWKTMDEVNWMYVADLRADDLTESVHYTNSKGEPQAYPRWQILLHQALHAAQHRSEAALLLSSLGASTGWLDYLIFIDEMRTAGAE